jgi:hypothetical protein
LKAHLFTLWFLATASDAIGAALAAFYLFRLKTRLSKFLALCLCGVAVEAAVAAVSLMVFWPDEFTAAPVFMAVRTIGRTVKMLCVWTLVLYLLNFCRGLHVRIDGGAR